MTARETILSFFKGELQNHIPFSAYPIFVPRGEKGRELRNRGLILIDYCSATLSQYHNVEVETKGAQGQLSIKEKLEPYDRIWTRTYHTPIGDVSEKIRREAIHGTSEWVVEHLIKKPSDYRILQYILENRTYDENCEAISKAQTDLGEGNGDTLFSKMPNDTIFSRYYQVGPSNGFAFFDTVVTIHHFNKLSGILL